MCCGTWQATIEFSIISVERGLTALTFLIIFLLKGILATSRLIFWRSEVQISLSISNYLNNSPFFIPRIWLPPQALVKCICQRVLPVSKLYKAASSTELIYRSVGSLKRFWSIVLNVAQLGASQCLLTTTSEVCALIISRNNQLELDAADRRLKANYFGRIMPAANSSVQCSRHTVAIKRSSAICGTDYGDRIMRSEAVACRWLPLDWLPVEFSLTDWKPEAAIAKECFCKKAF